MGSSSKFGFMLKCNVLNTTGSFENYADYYHYRVQDGEKLELVGVGLAVHQAHPPRHPHLLPLR